MQNNFRKIVTFHGTLKEEDEAVREIQKSFYFLMETREARGRANVAVSSHIVVTELLNNMQQS